MLYRTASTELWPTEWFGLTEEAPDSWWPEFVWAPGSSSILYVNQDRAGRSIVLMTVGGQETPLPLVGVPIVVLPGDLEALDA